MADDFQDALREQDWTRVEQLILQGSLEGSDLGLGLYYLADSERTELLRRVLEAGADPNHRSSPRPLQLAAKAGWTEHVALLLEHGADPGAGTSIGTPLSDAIEARQDGCAAMLVDAGAPVDRAGGWSALVRAAFRGLPQTTRAILGRGADVEARDTIEAALLRLQDEVGQKSGMAKLEALMKGVGKTTTRGQVTSFSVDPKQLVQRAKALSAHPVVDRYAAATAAIVAAGEGHREILELLVDAGADLSASDEAGLTPRAAALACGHEALAAWIAEQGGEEAPSQAPGEALHLAIEAGDANAVGLLLGESVDPDVRDKRTQTAGRTPLITALVAQQAAIAEQLLRAGADPDLRDAAAKKKPPYPLECVRPQDLASEPFRRWMTPLMVAATLDQADVVEHLAGHLAGRGADLDAKDVSRHTALMMAASNGCAAATDALLRAGADVAVRGPHRDTALTLAVGNDHTDCVRLLLAAGADANTIADDDPLLHAAIVLANDAMVNVLLEAGADPTVTNYAGKNPLEHAQGMATGMGRLSAKTLRRLEASLEQAADRAPDQASAAASEAAVPPDPAPLPRLSAADSQRLARPTILRELAQRAGEVGFLAAVEELGERCGSKAQNRVEQIGGYTVHVRSDRELDPGALQAELRARNCFVFASAGFDRAEELTILPTADPLEAVAAIGTDGANYEIEPDHVLAWLQARAAERSFAIVGIRHDLVALRFASPIVEVEALAHSMYTICPDVVDQGTDTIEALIEHLQERQRVVLWWD